MVSKKILAAVVCIAVLLSAVGAYYYLSQVGTNPKTFTFSWTGPIAEKLNVTTFWMNVTFDRLTENKLIITVRVNHLRFHEVHPDHVEYGTTYGHLYCVAIVFDHNNNGEFDENEWGYLYSGHNFSLGISLGDFNAEGQRSIGSLSPNYQGKQCECTFDPELGYTYVIPIWLEPDPAILYNRPVFELTNDLIHMEYCDYHDCVEDIPIVEFSFGKEFIA